MTAINNLISPPESVGIEEANGWAMRNIGMSQEVVALDSRGVEIKPY